MQTLPQSFDSQRMLISAVLDDQARFYEASGLVSASDFEDETFRWAWKAIAELCGRNMRPSLFNIREQFGTKEPGQFDTLRTAMMGMSDCIPSHAAEYARTLVERSNLRRIALAVDLLPERVNTAQTADAARQHVESAYMDACNVSTASRGFRKAETIIADLQNRLANPTKTPVYPTKFPALDRMLKGGLRDKKFVVIGGRTGGGKTVLAMNLAVNIAGDGHPVAAFSLEMDDVDLITRCVLSESWRGPDEAMLYVSKLPLHVDDTSNVTLKSIAARIKMMILRHACRVFIVDYLQLIGTDGQERESRERIVAGMSRLLKVTAKETGCCIIALSQLNEAGELRESRAIEQDADNVLYVIDNEDGEAFLRVVKNRGGKCHGPMKRMKDEEPGIPLNWTKENFKFTERDTGRVA